MNLMNSNHKATNQSYRDGYDNIQWDGKDKPIGRYWRCECMSFCPPTEFECAKCGRARKPRVKGEGG